LPVRVLSAILKGRDMPATPQPRALLPVRPNRAKTKRLHVPGTTFSSPFLLLVAEPPVGDFGGCGSMVVVGRKLRGSPPESRDTYGIVSLNSVWV
jgi:hypothetical protein